MAELITAQQSLKSFPKRTIKKALTKPAFLEFMQCCGHLLFKGHTIFQQVKAFIATRVPWNNISKHKKRKLAKFSRQCHSHHEGIYELQTLKFKACDILFTFNHIGNFLKDTKMIVVVVEVCYTKITEE